MENTKTKYILKKLYQLGVHVGHYRASFNSKLGLFLLGKRIHYDIINLHYTLFYLKKISYFLDYLSKKNGSLLFFSTFEEDSIESYILKQNAILCRQFYSNSVRGFVTNWILKYYYFFNQLIFKVFKFKYKIYSKRKLDSIFIKILFYFLIYRSYYLEKQQIILKKKGEDKSKIKSNLIVLRRYWLFYILFRFLRRKKFPSSVFLINNLNNYEIVNEFHSLRIPLISVVDSNNCYDYISYPIIGNDDSIICLYFYSYFISYNLNHSKKTRMFNNFTKE